MNTLVETGNFKVEYLKYCGISNNSESHHIRVDIGSHRADAIVYYNQLSNLYSFTQLCGGENIISNQIFGKIKNSLDAARKETKMEQDQKLKMSEITNQLIGETIK